VDPQLRQVAELGRDAGHERRFGVHRRDERSPVPRLRRIDGQAALWEFPTNSGILAPPTSFAIDGKQYIALESGWGGDSRGMQATLNRLFPGDYPEVPEGGAVWVFAI
jgi:hypothetical protein